MVAPVKLNIIQPVIKPYTQAHTRPLKTIQNCNHSVVASELLSLRRIFLAINFNHPYYENVPILEKFYKPIFPNYIICGPDRDKTGKHPVVKIPQRKSEYGFYGYQCVVEAIHRHPGFDGYLYINDDMIVNWWNFLKLDKKRLWFGEQFAATEGYTMGTDPPFWFKRADCGRRCAESFESMKKSSRLNRTNTWNIYSKNTNNKRICVAALSDIFYIPGRFAENFKLIAQEFFDNLVFLEVAAPMTLIMLDDKSTFTTLNGMYLQKKYGWGTWTGNSKRAWAEYNYKLHFLHPYKFTGENRQKNTGEFESKVIQISEKIQASNCLDAVSL